MAKVTYKCPQCGKVAEIISETRIESLGVLFKNYSCGHAVAANLIVNETTKSQRNKNWDNLFPHQKKGVEFIEQSDFNCLLADAMSLGKTIQVIQAIKENEAKFDAVLYIVKSALKYNWASEIITWYSDELHLIPYIIGQGDTPIIPGFKHYIISMSLLKKKWQELAERLNITLVVVDESHHFKNAGTGRSIYLNKLVNLANIKHVICTSGTPVLNRAGEYFTTLNLIKPEHWPSAKNFAWNWCQCDASGKPERILDWKRDEFFEKTKGYILRREKREVLKELPDFQRQFQKIDISDSPMVSEYNSTLAELERHVGTKQISNNNIMITFGYLNRLRRCCGIAKTPEVASIVKDFLAESDEKIAIGCHHKAVVQLFLKYLADYNPVTIIGGDSDEKRNQSEIAFRENPDNRILIANILAAGEGLNLQFCDNFILMERQWNAAKEEQFEGRFERPKKCFNCRALKQLKHDDKLDLDYYECPKCKSQEPKRAIIGTYYIAANTIDDYYTSMVESKRSICSDVLGDEFNIESNIDSVRELVDQVIQGGRL